MYNTLNTFNTFNTCCPLLSPGYTELNTLKTLNPLNRKRQMPLGRQGKGNFQMYDFADIPAGLSHRAARTHATTRNDFRFALPPGSDNTYQNNY